VGNIGYLHGAYVMKGLGDLVIWRTGVFGDRGDWGSGHRGAELAFNLEPAFTATLLFTAGLVVTAEPAWC